MQSMEVDDGAGSSFLHGGQAKSSRLSRVWIASLTVALASVCFGLTIAVISSVSTIHDFQKLLQADNDTSSDVCPISGFPAPYTPFYQDSAPANPLKEVAPPTVLKNATVWLPPGQFVPQQYIVFQNGKISSISPNPPNLATLGSNVIVHDVAGKYVTPGLVDMHSHLGVYAFPSGARGTDDGNEETHPTFPQLRAIDALNPEDPAIDFIRSGGVTTSVVLPGSGNVMGGEGAYVKLRGKTVGEMLFDNAPRVLKMACGENPKKVYGIYRGETPMTRMGIAWLMRKMFYQAAELKRLQDQWECQRAKGEVQNTPKPFDLELEPLVALLNHKAKLMVHCYKVVDLEMIIRTSHEFGFQVSVFHHALEAWKIPDLIRENNITIATFADHWGMKLEAFEASVHAPKLLTDAGVKVAIKSDHAVVYAKELIHEAGRVRHYGLSEQDTINAVTLIPATAMGVSHRIGSVAVGLDADIAVWNHYPLDLGARPEKVFIDGKLYVDNKMSATTSRRSVTQAQLVAIDEDCDPVLPKSLVVVRGATVHTMDKDNTVYENAVVVVKNGTVTCIGTGVSSCPLSPSEQQASSEYTVNGGVIIPGVVSTGAQLGQVEVSLEANTWDGVSSGLVNAEPIRAIDGIQLESFRSKHMRAAFAGGVTTVITSPQGNNLISGVGVAFHSHGTVVDDAVVHNHLSLHVHVGNNAKTTAGFTASIAGQFAQLRSLFLSNQGQSNAIGDALRGTLPVVAHINQADAIASMVRLKKELNIPKLVIMGGAEAHKVASLLATENVGVVLNPVLAVPSTFDTWNADDNAAIILNQAGVKVAFAITETGSVRNLRYDAGRAVALGLPYDVAVSAITSTAAHLFGVGARDHGNTTGAYTGEIVGSIVVGQKANFGVYSADPLSFDGYLKLLVLGDYVECNPQQL